MPTGPTQTVKAEMHEAGTQVDWSSSSRKTEVHGNWWHGFRRDAPEANGKFPANYVECR